MSEKARFGPKPKTIDPADYKRIAHLYGIGMTLEDLAVTWGMSPRTFEKYRQENPDLQAMLDAAKGEMTREVLDGFYYWLKKKDKGAIFFWLKTQKRWKETSTVENKIELTDNQEENVKKLADQIRKNLKDKDSGPSTQ